MHANTCSVTLAPCKVQGMHSMQVILLRVQEQTPTPDCSVMFTHPHQLQQAQCMRNTRKFARPTTGDIARAERKLAMASGSEEEYEEESSQEYDEEAASEPADTQEQRTSGDGDETVASYEYDDDAQDKGSLDDFTTTQGEVQERDEAVESVSAQEESVASLSDEEEQQRDQAETADASDSYSDVGGPSAAGPSAAAGVQGDSRSDDHQPDAIPSSSSPKSKPSGQGQKETQRYLDMLKSGQLKPTSNARKQDQEASKARMTSSLRIEDMVSPEVSANIFRRTSKVLTPGPGAYEPIKDRFGKYEGPGFRFGSARQRPPHVCITTRVVSPGPAYLPQKQGVSTLSQVPRISFPRQDVGTRFSMGSSQPTNCPHWNPGPGHYDVKAVYKGGSIEPNDGPAFAFAQGYKSTDSSLRLTTTAPAALGKQVAAGSLGPCSYDPDPNVIKPSIIRYSLQGKAPSYFDGFSDPSRQPSPGPIYSTSHMNHRGFRPWGEDPRPVFGKSKKQWEPEISLSATPFISKVHAHHSNQTLHSPGPVYFPELPFQHVQAPVFASGPPDRFYDRFEPGRMV